MKLSKRYLFLILIIFFLSFKATYAQLLKPPKSGLIKFTKAPISAIKIVNYFPHDTRSYTQGFVYHNGYFYESTGNYGRSFLKKIDIKSGKVIQEKKLGDEYFGEGMAIVGNRIYQLTWRNRTGFIYDLASFKEIGKFSYTGEGWGLATDGKMLYKSDGSEKIYCIDPKSMSYVRTITVTDGGTPVKNINELEFVRSEIWANVFTEDFIVRISPKTGEVLGWIDLSRLKKILRASAQTDVLNGIAYDSNGDRIFVTGKLWPSVFEIEIQN